MKQALSTATQEQLNDFKDAWKDYFDKSHIEELVKRQVMLRKEKLSSLYKDNEEFSSHIDLHSAINPDDPNVKALINSQRNVEQQIALEEDKLTKAEERFDKLQQDATDASEKLHEVIQSMYKEDDKAEQARYRAYIEDAKKNSVKSKGRGPDRFSNDKEGSVVSDKVIELTSNLPALPAPIIAQPTKEEIDFIFKPGPKVEKENGQMVINDTNVIISKMSEMLMGTSYDVIIQGDNFADDLDVPAIGECCTLVDIITHVHNKIRETVEHGGSTKSKDQLRGMLQAAWKDFENGNATLLIEWMETIDLMSTREIDKFIQSFKMNSHNGQMGIRYYENSPY